MPTLQTKIYRHPTNVFPGELYRIATVEAGGDQFRDAEAHRTGWETVYYWLRHSYGETDGPLLGPFAVANPPLVLSIVARDTSRWEGDGTATGSYRVSEVTLDYGINFRTNSTRVEYAVNGGAWDVLRAKNVDPNIAHSEVVGCASGDTVAFRVTPFSGYTDANGNPSGTAGPMATVSGVAT